MRAVGQTVVAYQNKEGGQVWAGLLEALLKDWKTGNGANLSRYLKSTKQMGGDKGARIRALVERDGSFCWYCAREFLDALNIELPLEDRLTIEEVCPRQVGGPVHIKNQVLACHRCNHEAGSLSVAEKVVLRDRKRGYGIEQDAKSREVA